MKSVLILIVLLMAVAGCFAQNARPLPEIKRIELYNSVDISGPKPVFNRDLYQKACLNLITLEHGCGSFSTIHFGTQIGVNVNIFQVNGGRENRTRMIRIGKFDWT